MSIRFEKKKCLNLSPGSPIFTDLQIRYSLKEKKKILAKYMEGYKKLSSTICKDNMRKSHKEYARRRLMTLRRKVTKTFSPYKKSVQAWFNKNG